MAYIEPISAIAIVAVALANALAAYDTYQARDRFRELWRQGKAASCFLVMDCLVVVLGIFSGLLSHVAVTGQICQTPDEPMAMKCSAYRDNIPAWKALLFLSGIANGTLILAMNYISALRWKQLRRSVPYNDAFRLGALVLFTFDYLVRIISLGIYVASDLPSVAARTAMMASAAVQAFMSVIFDITICFLIGNAIFRIRTSTDVSPRSNPNEDGLDSLHNSVKNSLADISEKAAVSPGKRAQNLGGGEMRLTSAAQSPIILINAHTVDATDLIIFKLSLLSLIVTDCIQIAASAGLSQTSFANAGISIGIAAVVFHTFLTKELLRSFVEKAFSKEDGSHKIALPKSTKSQDNLSPMIAGKSLKDVRATSELHGPR